MILAVDLAARFSAGIGREQSGGQVTTQFDSWGKSATAFSFLIVSEALDMFSQREEPVDDRLILIEDVPYGISNQSMVKPVLRLQGILINDLARHNLLDRTLFVNPSTWQRHFPGVFKGGEMGAREAAEARGYTPPDLHTMYAADIPEKGPERSKVLAQIRKAKTDYIDAFLMTEWANELGEEALRATKNVQPAII